MLSRLKALVKLQSVNHSLLEGAMQTLFCREISSDSMDEQGHIDTTKWKKIDSRAYGITRSMISLPSWTVLKVLHSQGFEAYLVGGCVRDLLLKRTPKDFDVITTANLQQIRKQFYRAQIVGRRFPICLVHVRGSVIEVSSFGTVGKHAEEKEKDILTKMPTGCNERDFIRWRNCMHRDFTINSLFFDPFVNKIYDYANGMRDLMSLKLQTLIPAPLSFKEDCARILRGIRIAARLGLSLSKETENAIRTLSSSIKGLDKSRMLLELNYMLSYGAAGPSLCLLRRFNLLEVLLPYHAAHLAQQVRNQSAQSPVMLMKLFFNLDKLLSCQRPSNCNLWVGLLAFHMALADNPQDALVVWTFSSVMYHGKWKEGVKFAREHAHMQLNFDPEFSEPCDYKSDQELAEKVSHFASLVQEASFDAFAFVSKKMGRDVGRIFDVLVNGIESYKKGRESFKIDYFLLGKGNLVETRFVLGKVILDTLYTGVVREGVVTEKNHIHSEQKQELLEEGESHLALSDTAVVKEGKKHRLLPSQDEVEKEDWVKKQKLVEKKCNIPNQEIANKQNGDEKQRSEKWLKKHQKVAMEGSDKQERRQEATKKDEEKLIENGKYREKKHLKVKRNSHISKDEVTQKPEMVVDKDNCHLQQQEVTREENDVVREEKHKHKQVMKEKTSKPPLSRLFK